MKHNLTGYKRIGKVALGCDLKMIFANIHNSDNRKVLVLNNVVGYFDVYQETEILTWLRVDNGVGSCGDDLAIRLKRPEISTFDEIFYLQILSV